MLAVDYARPMTQTSQPPADWAAYSYDDVPAGVLASGWPAGLETFRIPTATTARGILITEVLNTRTAAGRSRMLASEAEATLEGHRNAEAAAVARAEDLLAAIATLDAATPAEPA